MPYTQVKFNKDAIDAVYEGVREVAEVVATTLGPLGRNVLIDKGYEPAIIHDGVKVSLTINPEEPFKRNGALVMQEAAKKQRDMVGDGTTAVCILAMAILDETLKATAAGINPMTLRRGLESGSKKVIERLSKLAKPVKTLKQKIQIATISAEDEALGLLIAETIHKAGDNGIITIEESKANETYAEHQEGMQIDKGYMNPWMVTDPDRRIAVLEDAYVFVTDYPLNNIAEIAGFLESKVIKNTKKVLFIAPEIGDEFVHMLIGAKISAGFLGVAIRAPGIGQNQLDILQDICALTGATFLTREANMIINDQPFEALGQVHRIVSSNISTILTGGNGHKDDILQRIQIIKAQMADETVSDYDREQLEGRLAKLTNGVAVIKVAGQTDVEMKERKERADDAVCSTQAAIRNGFIAGGEISYLNCLDVLDESILGEKILKEALKKPFKRLVENAGYDSGEKYNELTVVARGVLSKKEIPFPLENYGFDVSDGHFKNMIQSGIIDAVSVPINAVKTAVSVAVQLSSLGAAVVLMNEEKK